MDASFAQSPLHIRYSSKIKSNIGDDSGDTWRNIIRVPCHTALFYSCNVSNLINITYVFCLYMKIISSLTGTYDEHKAFPLMLEERKVRIQIIDRSEKLTL